MRVLLLPLVLGGLLLLGAGCDAAPGPADPGGRPPVVSGLVYSPPAVGAHQTADDTMRVPLSVEVTAVDPDGAVARVAYVVQSPVSGRDPVARGTLTRAAGNTYRAEALITFPKAEVGKYTVIVYAVDDAGQVGNDVRGLIDFIAVGSPPVIESVEADPPVVRPPATLRLIATVSDPDGLANISRVIGRTPSGASFELYDDGRSRGDAVAGDGRYTAQFDVPQATPGVQTFTFQAFDRTGLASAVVEKPVTIEAAAQ